MKNLLDVVGFLVLGLFLIAGFTVGCLFNSISFRKIAK